MKTFRPSPYLVFAVVLVACQDPAQAPLPITMQLSPELTTSGGTVTLTSPQFVNLVLVPSTDTTAPRSRWANLLITVEGDTADAWRVGPDQIAFRVPPVLTGNHEVRVAVAGHDPGVAWFFARGLAYPPYGRLQAYTNLQTGLPVPNRGLLLAEDWRWPGFATGYLIWDAEQHQLEAFPALVEHDSNHVQMSVPGPSYRRDHFVMGLTPDSAPYAQVWRATPSGFVLADTVPCASPGRRYTAAEIAPGVCLLADGFAGAVLRNGVDTLMPVRNGYQDSQFRLATGGRWTVLRMRPDAYMGATTTRWPVFDQTGAVAYTIDTLQRVTGAAFSPNGDTLFAAVSIPDTSARGPFEGRFSLAVFDAATGRTIASRPFDARYGLEDVLVDPARGVLYVAAVERSALWSFDQWQELMIFDRGSLELLATITAASRWFTGGDAVLVFGGPGRPVHAFVWCGFDCGGVWDFAYDVP